MDQIVFYILVVAILGLVGVVVMLATAYLKIQEKIARLAKQNDYINHHNDTRVEEILKEAKDRALIIIDQANKKAASTLTSSQTLSNDLAGSMQKSLDEASKVHVAQMQKASEELLQAYKEALEKIKSEDIQNAANISKNIDKITEEQLSQFKDILAKETINSEKVVDAKIDSEYKGIENELKAYREEKLKKVDQNILQIIQSVTEVLLQKQLSISEQEQLVYDALTKMKQRSEMN